MDFQNIIVSNITCFYSVTVLVLISVQYSHAYISQLVQLWPKGIDKGT